MIPKRLLIHSIILEKKITPKPREAPFYSAGVTVENVRIEDLIDYRKYGDGSEIQGNTLMFWDFNNSTSATFEVGDQVQFDGRYYKITQVPTIPRLANHHQEIIMQSGEKI